MAWQVTVLWGQPASQHREALFRDPAEQAVLARHPGT